MTLQPLFYALYAMLGCLIGWAVSAGLVSFVIVYGLIAVALAAVHLAYLNDRQRERNHNDNDIDWDY
jgi:uncharacterized membrane protein